MRLGVRPIGSEFQRIVLEDLGGSIVMEDPQKWMVYVGKSHLEMDDDWGYPHDLGNFQYWDIELVKMDHHLQLLFIKIWEAISSQRW